VDGIRKAINSSSSINTFIAIGDGSLETAKAILDSVPKVKLVLYGMGFGNSKDMTGFRTHVLSNVHYDWYKKHFNIFIRF